MSKKLDMFKCPICGNIVEVNNPGGGTLVCCGKNMDLLDEKSADFSTEKHVPVVEKIQGGYKVTVGSTLHPMTDEHYIQWVELITEDDSITHFFKPGDTPSCQIMTDKEVVKVREYCNLHGLWIS